MSEEIKIENKHLLLIKNKAEEMSNFLFDFIKSQNESILIKKAPIFSYYEFEGYVPLGKEKNIRPKYLFTWKVDDKYLFTWKVDDEEYFAKFIEENMTKVDNIKVDFYLRSYITKEICNLIEEYNVELKEYLNKNFFCGLFKKLNHSLNENKNLINESLFKETLILADINFTFDYREHSRDEEKDILVVSSFINFHTHFEIESVFWSPLSTYLTN